MITVAPPPPASITAVSQADLSIGPAAFRLVSVTWPAVTGAATYELRRATSINGIFSVVASPASNSWTDAPTYSSLPQTYIYQVWSVASSGTRSVTGSPKTFATVGSPLFTDEPLQQYVTTIKGIHIGELRRAVDEVRRAAGQPPSWSSYAPATGLVSFSDNSTLRTSLDAACSSIRGTPCSYAGPAPAVNGPVLAVQVQSIRDAVK